jgi:hypothetical protein
MKGYPEEEKWGRDKARRLYGKDNMVSMPRTEHFKNAGSELTHKYPDMSREPVFMQQNSPHHSTELGQTGEKHIEPVQTGGQKNGYPADEKMEVPLKEAK